jgi:hypothetical protein
MRMTLTGTFLRMIGAAILLIVVQFASVAANAHVGHGRAPDGHYVQGLHHKGSSAAAGIVHAASYGQAAQAPPAVQAEPAAQETAAQNAPGALPPDSDACVMGCCSCTGCCAAALVAVSPHLPPSACSPRISFARAVSVPGVDPRGLRKPPRSLA